VRRVIDLVRLRNTHPAFDGELCVETEGRTLRLRWSDQDGAALTLDVDLAVGRAVLEDQNARTPIADWSV
jgi:hypothetical protein